MKKSMGFGERCKNSGLGLGLGLGVHDDDEGSDHRNCMKSYYLGREKEEEDKVDDDDGLKCKYPCLTLGRPDHEINNDAATKMSPECGEYNLQAIQQQQSNCGSGDSWFSNSSSMKRERESEVDGEIEITKLPNNSTCSRLPADVDDDGNPRKKLRLTKEQSAVLEDSFKHHSTLNPKQKQDLASKLKLRARQVEVWFQNRRARTKLKQTEVECELLKKCCETLTEENKRLQKELQELRSIKTTPQQGGSFYMQLPAAAAVCPSCGGGATTTASPAATAFLIGSQAAHHLYKTNYPFTHSSAAC